MVARVDREQMTVTAQKLIRHHPRFLPFAGRALGWLLGLRHLLQASPDTERLTTTPQRTTSASHWDAAS